MKKSRTSDFAEPKGRQNASPRVGGEEQRAFPRTKLSLPGRYMLEDGQEYACETIDVSPTGVLLKVEMVAAPGERVIAYVEGLGRIEGVVVRTLTEGFALALSSAPRKTERLAELIEWLAQDNYGPAKERRCGPRVDLQGAFVLLVTANRLEHAVELIDVSAAGVAFLTDIALEIGEAVELGAQRAEVARLFPGGAAVAFL